MKQSIARLLAGTLGLALVAACGGGADDAAPVAEEPSISAAPAPLDSATAATTGALLDPNAATLDELLAVPGIDQATADALIAGRPYANMLEVDRVLAGSLDDAQREAVYASLWYPLDLNSASGDEILLIPGVGERMRHEFEEYRPYRGIEQFRREIGKYVDEQEVARLETYVTIR